jgi:hypothetical protein
MMGKMMNSELAVVALLLLASWAIGTRERKALVVVDGLYMHEM